MQEKKKDRIIFIDLIRAFAVLMMVQGHTVDSLLADDYRTFDSLIYNFWFFMRGLTAPIFLFSAGTVFTYLLRNNELPFSENPRVKKGIKRFFLLLGLGYLLRYPTPWLVYFGNVTKQQWEIFFTVDVLHMIGFGILIVTLLSGFSQRFKIRDSVIFSTAAFIVFLCYPIFRNIEWTDYLPVPIAAYFYQGTGSLFPLFPWVGYVIAGAVLGSYLALNKGIFKTKRFSLDLSMTGIFFIGLSFIGCLLEIAFYRQSDFWNTSPFLIPFRLGLVLLLNSAVSYISISIKNIPPLLIQVGRHTLSIYIVHLVILYGSAWSLGISYFIGRQLDVFSTVTVAVIMIALMIGMVQSLQFVKHKFKKRALAEVPVRN